jgi:alkylation response protein AidB-like acyl-CoA dehydrogenase
MNDAPDAYAAVVDLIALVTDAKASGKRLSELQALEERIAKTQAKLDADRAEHDRVVTTSRAELDERDAKLRKREVDVMIRDNALREAQRILDASKPPRFHDDANLGPGGRSYSGLTREPEYG